MWLSHEKHLTTRENNFIIEIKMKQFFTSFVAVILLFSAQAQLKPKATLLQVEGTEISVAEFERVFNKNASVAGPDADQKSVEEYMEMYINFKLKVKEAERRQMDTARAFKQELNQYVTQLEQPYLTDSEYIDELIQEGYERSQTDLRASHIMVKLDEDASPVDTAKAYKKAYKIYKEAQTGVDFEKLAREKSEDPSVKQNGGDLGWFSAFRMVYEFENAAFNTPEGEVSKPVRSRFGYHVIKVMKKRPAMPEIKAAHIMIKHEPGAKDDADSKAKNQIDDIHQKLNKGEDFATLAKRYSDDKSSARRGGTLPAFTTGRMVPEFEEAVYHLEQKGQITQPLKTDFGWHIAVLLERTPQGSFEEEKEEIRRKVERDNRGADSQKRLALKLQEEYNVKIKTKNVKALEEHLDSAYFAGERENSPLHDAGSKTILQWKDKKYGAGKVKVPQSELAEYLLDLKTNNPKDPETFLCDAFDQFKIEQMLEFERSVLPQKYPEFGSLTNEYREGILLFSLMDEMVWRKANTDTAGLEKFYEKNKGNYMWPLRYDLTTYIAEDEAAADEIFKLIESGHTDSSIIAQLNENSSLGVKVKNALVNSENELLQKAGKPKSGITKVKEGGEWYVIKVNEILDPRAKTIDEARGAITSDYQDYLEKKWLMELREKYDFTVNQKQLKLLSEKYQ